ncbi:MAG TPA: hypothetical protein VNL36_07065 [Bacteroidota bacterium]|nr:hypothetical protein [Bacteroidota bacterium]
MGTEQDNLLPVADLFWKRIGPILLEVGIARLIACFLEEPKLGC